MAPQRFTGDNVTLLASAISNETGTITRSVTEAPDGDGYVGWIDITVDVSPRSSVAIDTLAIRVWSDDALLLPDDFLRLSLGRHEGSGVVNQRFARPELRGVVSPILCAEDGSAGLLWPATSYGIANSANDQRLGLVRTDSSGKVDPIRAVGPAFTSLLGAVAGRNGETYIAGGMAGDVSPTGRPYFRVYRLLRNGQLDETYRSPAFDSIGRFMALGKDGKVIVTSGGLRASNNGGLHGVYRLNADGSRDETFGPPTIYRLGAPDPSSVMADPVVDDEGRILIGGQFERVNNTPRASLVRLLPDGTVDEVFIPSGFEFLSPFNTYVRSIVVQSDGRVIVGGRRFILDGDPVEYMAIRLNEDGSVDRSFRSVPRGTGGESSRTIRALRELADGRLVMAGETVFRVFADGMIDASMSIPTPTPLSVIVSLALPDPDRIVLVGFVDFLSPSVSENVVALTGSGVVDSGFIAPTLQTEEYPAGLVATSRGGLLAWGAFDRVGLDRANSLVRLHPNGMRDDTFGISVTNVMDPALGGRNLATNIIGVKEVRRLADGGFYAMVTTGDQHGFPATTGLWRFKGDGNVDPAFLGQGRPVDGTQLVQNELVCWHNDVVYNVFSLNKVLDDGSEDPAFVSFKQQIGDYVFTAWNSIERYAVGWFDVVAVGGRKNGQILVSMTDAYSEDDELRFHHRLYVMEFDGSNVAEYGIGALRGMPGIERYADIYNPITGTLEQTRVVHSGGSPYRDARFLDDGRLIIAGVLDYWKGGEPLRLARMTASNYDPTFDVRISRGEGLIGEAAAEVHSVYVDASNRVWITGDFTHVNGVGRGGVARLDTDGALDMTFDPAVEYLPFTSPHSGLAADATGAVYLWGTYRQPNDLWPYGITKLHPEDPLAMGVSMVDDWSVDLSVSSPRASAVITERSVDLMVWTAVSTNQVAAESNSVRIPQNGESIGLYRLRVMD